jgi:glucose/arabinose dehydrogenase
MNYLNLFAASLFSWLFSIGFSFGQHEHHQPHLPKPKGVSPKEIQAVEADFYKMVTLGTPSEAILEGGGICRIPNGRMAVATRRGEIWIVQNPYSLTGQAKPTFHRFARGIHEILGMAYKNGSFFVAQRGELTKITDTDGDGQADDYQCITRLPTVGHYHEYSFGPVFDAEGNMVVSLNVAFGDVDWYNAKSFAPWRGWIIKISPEGKILPWAAGVRSPCGIGLGPESKVFYTENQGDWVGSGYITVAEKGDFIANPASLRWANHPESPVLARPEHPKGDGRPLYKVKNDIPGLRLPSVWLPHGVLGVSTSDFNLDSTGGKFGPFGGQYLVGDQGQSKIVRVAFEKVKDVWQGSAFGFREGFASGVLRLAWGEDASLFVAQTNRGWASTGTSPYALQRLVWTGKMPFEMHHISARPDGFEVFFTKEVDSASAINPSSWSLSHFIYKYHNIYGSPLVEEGGNPLKAILLSPDRKSVRLIMDSLTQFHIHEIKAEGLLSTEGEELLHRAGYYTLNEMGEGEKANLAKAQWIFSPTKAMPNLAKTATKPKEKEPVLSKNALSSKSGIEGLVIKNKRVSSMPGSWTNGPDKTITLGTTPGMRYDKEQIEVNPGQKIRLIFNNYDSD